MLAENNIAVTLVSSPGEELDFIARQYLMPFQPVRMSRSISPLQDIRSLFHLVRLFKLERFEIVHSSTPKAGLLGAVAGWLTRIPVRLHTYTGQAWVELHGLQRWLVRWSDKVVGFLNTYCYADSFSQRDFLVKEGIVKASKIAVLASGSISGVDLGRFDPELWRGIQASATRQELCIPDNALVILFVGRITRDKGIVELVSAFNSLEVFERKAELVLVGPFEPQRDPLPKSTINELMNHPRMHVIGFTRQPEKYMGIADVFCLPSYREGFGSVVIEAAAMGVPAVVTSIVGLVDAVVQGETGLLVPPKDDQSLRNALFTILVNPELRDRMGTAARLRAQNLFDAALVNQVVTEEYRHVYCRCYKRQY